MSNQTQGNLPQPDDRRMNRTGVTSYDKFVALLILLFLVAFFLVSWLAETGVIGTGDYAAAIFLALPAAMLLYHFLDTRARLDNEWVSLTGAGAIAAAVIVGFFYWQGRYMSSLQPELKKALMSIQELETERDHLRPITVMFPIEDETGQIERGVPSDFVMGVQLRGEPEFMGGEFWLIVDGVPPKTSYQAFVFHKQTGNLGNLSRTSVRIELNEDQPPDPLRLDQPLIIR